MTGELSKVDHGHKWMPVLYTCFYGILKDVAERNGYALALHGSLVRDLDLVAIPWADDACHVSYLVGEFCSALGCPDNEESLIPKPKPHGRIAYRLITGSGGYVDLSVMPRIVQPQFDEADTPDPEKEPA